MTDDRPIITEAEAERILDRRIWEACNRSPDYRNAENAEQQSEAERRIEARENHRLANEYRVAGWSDDWDDEQ